MDCKVFNSELLYIINYYWVTELFDCQLVFKWNETILQKSNVTI